MPGREVKDELRPEGEAQETQTSIPTPDSFQLPLTPEQEAEVADIVKQDWESAKEARDEKVFTTSDGEGMNWEEKFATLIELYENQGKPRPEKWMSKGSLRIAMAVVEMMFAKLYPNCWNDDMVKWRAVEYTDQPRVDRINKFMYWIVRVEMKLRKKLKHAIKSCIKLGTTILKDKWVVEYKDLGETQAKTIVDETGQPIPDQMGQPQTIEERILSIKERCEVEHVKLDKFYIQPGQTDIQKEPVIHLLELFYSDLELLEMQGKAKNVQTLLKPSIDDIIMSELDDVREASEKVAKTNVRRRKYPLNIIEWYGKYDADGDGFEEECVFLVDNKKWIYLGGIPLKVLSKDGTRPFTKMGFILREFAFYWIGVLEQLKPLADELDSCMRQLIDANTLAIMKWGFYDPAGDYEPETHKIKPRAMYPVGNPTQNVYFPDMNVPTEKLLHAIRLIMEFVERLTAASSYAMGKESEIVGGSGTATRTQAITTSAQERFAIPAENIRDAIGDLLTRILRQYQQHIPPGLEKRVLGEKGEMLFKEGELNRASIEAELDAYLLPSASGGDKNVEMQIANWVYQNLMMNPLVAGSLERVYKVSEKPLKAMGIEPEELLGAKRYSKPSSDPGDEHTMMRAGLEVHPLPEEQHIHHLMQHTAKMQDPEIAIWPQEALMLLQAHIQETQQLMNQMIQMTIKAKGGAGGAGKESKSGSGAPSGVQAEPGKGGADTGGSANPNANQQAGVAGGPQVG